MKRIVARMDGWTRILAVISIFWLGYGAVLIVPPMLDYVHAVNRKVVFSRSFSYLDLDECKILLSKPRPSSGVEDLDWRECNAFVQGNPSPLVIDARYDMGESLLTLLERAITVFGNLAVVWAAYWFVRWPVLKVLQRTLRFVREGFTKPD